MGTRGLRIVVFRGRYFVYYIPYDAYPEGVGEQFVRKVPTTTEAYAGKPTTRVLQLELTDLFATSMT